jgi:hypothetical protein
MGYLLKTYLGRVSLIAGLLGVSGTLPAAADTFLGVEVKPIQGTFLVTKDVNVRTLPVTASKRISRLKKGAKVQGVGRPKDAAWIAVNVDGKDLGFVYAPVLLPLLNGEFDGEIVGTTEIGNGRQCKYSIRFEGKSKAGRELFEIVDYEVLYVCSLRGVITKFSAFMFMAEAPFRVSKSSVHQITIDLQAVAAEVDDVLSTNFLFDPRKKRLVFDGVSLKKLGKKPASKFRPAGNLKNALKAAAEMAPSIWTETVWKNLKNPKL